MTTKEEEYVSQRLKEVTPGEAFKEVVSKVLREEKDPEVVRNYITAATRQFFPLVEKGELSKKKYDVFMNHAQLRLSELEQGLRRKKD